MADILIAAFVPAHNEAATIAATIRSLQRQLTKFDQITVVCDNCTDETEWISRSLGVGIFVTTDNYACKAGALNQALRVSLPRLSTNDLVILVDADSELSHRWIPTAAAYIRTGRADAICGAFYGRAGGGLVGQLQRNEYARYGRMVRNRRQVPVLSGTGTMLRVRDLWSIAAQRGSRLPGTYGQFYDEGSITEDNEITLAAKHLGLRCLVPVGCETFTEVMPTWGDLFRQRLRWQRGALSDLRVYGLTKITLPYWLRQAEIYGSLGLSIVVWVIIGWGLLLDPGFNLAWTVGILLIYLVEHIHPRMGLRGLTLALLVVPEIAYDLFRIRTFVRALVDELRGHEMKWHIVEAPLSQNAA